MKGRLTMLIHISIDIAIFLLAVFSEQMAIGLGVVLKRPLNEILWLVVPGGNLGVFFYYYFPEEWQAVKKFFSRGKTSKKKDAPWKLWALIKIYRLNASGWKILVASIGTALIIIPIPFFTYILGIATFRIVEFRYKLAIVILAVNLRVFITAKGAVHISPLVYDFFIALGF